MKTLFLCRVAKGRHGVQTQWLAFFRRFVQTDHVAFCFVSRICLLERCLREVDVPFKLLSWRFASKGLRPAVLYGRLLNQLAYFRMARIARRFGPDLIEGDINEYPLLRYLSKETGAAIVCRVRSHDVFNRDLGDFNFVDRFIPLSKRLAAPLLRAGVPESKIEIINDGVDVEYFTPGEEVSRVTPLLRVGIVGRIEPFKRIGECLKIAHDLKVSGTPFSFSFVGASFRPEYFQEVIDTRKALGLEDECHFISEMSDMREFYRSIDVLLTLSGGSVMLEAMAMGKPVVAATPVTPQEHSIVRDGETGFVYGEADLVGVAEGLRTLAHSPGRLRELGKAGREKVVETFNIEKLVERTLDVYRDLVETRRLTRYPKDVFSPVCPQLE